MYDRLIDKAESGKITAAEVHLLINGFDQAELYQYEQQRELSISLLQDWLVQYKFKNWKITQTRQKRVVGQFPITRLIRSWRPVCGTRHLIFESGGDAGRKIAWRCNRD